MLYTHDLAAARPYYTEVLGLRVAQEHPGGVLEFAAGGGAKLALVERPDQTGDAQPARAELWFMVPDADAYHAEVMTAGARILEAPHTGPFGRAFRVATPEGHTLVFHTQGSDPAGR